jgi:hypothetical protein
MFWTQKFSFSRDLVILDLKLQLAVTLTLLDFLTCREGLKLRSISRRRYFGVMLLLLLSHAITSP